MRASRYQANNVRAQGEGFVFSEYATSHPTGTGPFRFVGYDEANGTVELARYGEYWGEPATLDRLPDPQSIFGAIREDLEVVGITVNPVSRPWAGGYTDTTEVGDAPVFLLGWTGDYNSPHNFVGTFFSGTEGMFHTGQSPWGQELSARLQAADSEPEEATRIGMYEDVSRSLMADYLAARRRGTWLDNTGVVSSLVGVAVLVFFLAFLLKFGGIPPGRGVTRARPGPWRGVHRRPAAGGSPAR